jgi:hypothetical protein
MKGPKCSKKPEKVKEVSKHTCGDCGTRFDCVIAAEEIPGYWNPFPTRVGECVCTRISKKYLCPECRQTMFDRYGPI